MDAEGLSISPQNYYIRLNEVLFGEFIQNAPLGFNRSDFGKLWKHLQQWVWEHYEVELHLSEGPPNRKYVWYPMSQCRINRHTGYSAVMNVIRLTDSPGAVPRLQATLP